MNRRSRRPLVSALATAYAAQYRCPDCLSETTQPVPAPGASGVWLIEVRHNDTCPTYRRLRAEGRAS